MIGMLLVTHLWKRKLTIFYIFFVCMCVWDGVGGAGGAEKAKDQSFIYFVFIYLSICVNLLL